MLGFPFLKEHLISIIFLNIVESYLLYLELYLLYFWFYFKNMIELVYCFEKLEKTIKIDEFNEFLKVIDIEHEQNKIFIKLKQL